MANPFLGVRIPADLNEAILARMRQTGQSKSEIVIDALKVYLGMSPQQDRLDSVEERLSALEVELGLTHRDPAASPHDLAEPLSHCRHAHPSPPSNAQNQQH